MLSFNHKGTTHQTTCGGVMSILIKTFMVFYLWVNVSKLIYRGEDNFNSVLCGSIGSFGVIDIGVAKPVALILKKSRENKGLQYDDETKKHIRVRFSQYSWNHTKSPSEIEDELFEMRPCTKEDFN